MSFTYLISKFLPLIFSPLGATFALLVIYIIKKKKKFIYSSLVFLFFFSNGIVGSSLWKILEYPWKKLDLDTLLSADGIVVLSGGIPQRFSAGIDLYKAAKADRLIFTGGKSPLDSNAIPEGDLHINKAISMGIPIENLFTTYPVFNTYQEAKAVQNLLKTEIILTRKKIILVTSAFHMNRAKRVFEKEGFDVQPFPVDFQSESSYKSLLSNPFNWFPTASSLERSSSAIREFIGRIIYQL